VEHAKILELVCKCCGIISREDNPSMNGIGPLGTQMVHSVVINVWENTSLGVIMIRHTSLSLAFFNAVSKNIKHPVAPIVVSKLEKNVGTVKVPDYSFSVVPAQHKIVRPVTSGF